MKKLKKVIIVCSTLALVLSLSVSALAYNIGENSKYVLGYGNLYGCLYDDGLCVTTVEKNPDNAVLSIVTSAQDIMGNTLRSRQVYSNPGDRTLTDWWPTFPANTYVLYGAHGVQGGQTYASAVVYTVTHDLMLPPNV